MLVHRPKRLCLYKPLVDDTSGNNYNPPTFFLRKYSCFFIFIFIEIVVTGLINLMCLSPVWSKDPKSVLILHSYRPNYQWTDNINNGILDVFNKYTDEIDLRTEYMDVRSGNDALHFEVLKDLYFHKYKHTNFDSIICADNYALNFLIKYRNELLIDAPIVFCGINRYQDAMLKGHKTVTGVVEDIDIEATLGIISKLHPKMEKFVIWSVDHKRADAYRQETVSIAKSLNPEIEIVHLRGQSLKNGLKTIVSLTKNDVVFLLTILKDDFGNIIPADYTAKEIANNSKAPIYSLYDIFLGHGIIGGKLVSGYSQGQAAAEMVKDILDGKSAEEISILEKSPNRFMFDANQLTRNKIDFGLLPAEGVIVNRDVGFYEKYRFWIWGIFVFIVFQTTLIIYLIYNLKKRKVIEATLERARDNLEHEVSERTLELQYSLSFNEAVTSSSPVGILVYDIDGRCKTANKAAANIVGASIEQLKSQNFYEIESWRKSGLLNSAKQAIAENKITRKEISTTSTFGKELWIDCRFATIEAPGGLQLILVVDEITEQKNLIEEREQLIRDLKATLSEVKTLRGFLPICSNCKNIRDDKGYWQGIEAYVSKHSSAEFSHSICPKCAKKLYPDLDIYDD